VRRSLAVLRAAYYASLDQLPFLTHRVVVVFLAALVASLALFGAVLFISATDWPVPDPGPAATPLTSTTLGIDLTTQPPSSREPPTTTPRPASGPGASEAGSGGSGEPRGGAESATTRGPGRSTTSGTTTTTGVTVTLCVPGVTCVTVP
jgi:hypothetical protein